MKRAIISFCIAASAIMAWSQRIAVLSDIHVTPGNPNAEYLRAAVDEINHDDFDIVVLDGDLTNEGSNQELTYVKSILDQIQKPFYLLPGNHEDTWSQSATKTFVDLWGNDRFVTSAGDRIVVGINCGPYMKMGDGHVKQEDLHWLKNTLDSLSSDSREVISFNHYPIRKDDLDNYREYVALLQQYPVVVHINGHYHRWDRYTTSDVDAVTVRALTVDDTHGYSILDLDSDSITVYEKLIGQDPTIKYKWAINSKHTPDPSLQSASYVDPDGFNIIKAHADEASIFTRLAVDADNVYFCTSLGMAKAIDKATGEVVWTTPIASGASIFSRPVVLSGDLLSIPHPTGISVLNKRSGAVVAEYPSADGPYVADGLMQADSIYIQGGYKRIERRNPNDAALVWTFDSINNYCQAAPVVDGDDVIFGAWDTYLRCLDANTGSMRWKWNNGKEVNLVGPGNVVPAVTPHRVVIVAPDRVVTSIDRLTGTTVWRDNSHRFRESLGQSADGNTVFAKTMDGELVAMDANADAYTELWLCDMGLGYDHAPCPILEVDGVVYAGSRRGIITAVSADTHQVLWQQELGASEVNGIEKDPSDSSVWVSLIEGTVFHIKPSVSE